MKQYTNYDLKNISWIKIGGIVREYYETETTTEFQDLIARLIKEGKKFDVIGWGANTLFTDGFYDIILIKDKTNSIIPLENTIEKSETAMDYGTNRDRHKAFKNEQITSGFEYDDINYIEEDVETMRIRVSAGTSLPFAINSLIDKGITGLQLFSGIPGTIGGSAFNNIHGGPRLFSEFIDEASFITSTGDVMCLSKDELGLAYNDTIFQRNGYYITELKLKLFLGDKDRARHSAVLWAKRKSSQPKNSIGSTFHNLTAEDQTRLNYPTPSVAYIIEHIIKMSGFRIGNVMIPEQTPPDTLQINKNILVNCGNGTAADYLAVMKEVYRRTFEQIGVRLKQEIFFKGFSDEELKPFVKPNPHTLANA